MKTNHKPVVSLLINFLVLTVGCVSQDTINTSPSAPLSITSSYTTTPNGVLLLSPSGGKSPYTYSIISGDGQIFSSGIFDAPNYTETTYIQIKDDNGHIALTTVEVISKLSVSYTPSSPHTSSGTITLKATQGVAPYTYTVINGTGTINQQGVYTITSSEPETVEIQVQDNARSKTTVKIEIKDTTALSLSPTSVKLTAGSSFKLTASGGYPDYTCTIDANDTEKGTCTVQSSKIIFTANRKASGTKVNLTVSDQNQNSQSVMIEIQGNPRITGKITSPAKSSVVSGNVFLSAELDGPSLNGTLKFYLNDTLIAQTTRNLTIPATLATPESWPTYSTIFNTHDKTGDYILTLSFVDSEGYEYSNIDSISIKIDRSNNITYPLNKIESTGAHSITLNAGSNQIPFKAYLSGLKVANGTDHWAITSMLYYWIPAYSKNLNPVLETPISTITESSAYTELSCLTFGSDYRVVGFYGRSAVIIDQIGVICRNLDGTSGNRKIDTSVGETGGNPFTDKVCPNSQFVVGVTSWETSPSEHLANHLGGFELICGK